MNILTRKIIWDHIGLYKTDREIYQVRYGIEKTERNIEKFNLFVGKKRSSGLFAACAFARCRGGSKICNRKTPNANRRSGSLGESWSGGGLNFRRGLGINELYLN